MKEAFIVGVVAILYNALIFVWQRYTQEKYGIKEKQILMKEKQKLIQTIYKTKDPKDPKVMDEINKIQKEIMSLSMETMKLSFKNMIWIMLIGLILLGYVMHYQHGKFPFGTVLGLSPVVVWYIVVSVVSNVIFKLVFVVLEKVGVISE